MKISKTDNVKMERLQSMLKKMRRVVVAYSGGIDSTFLLHSAHAVLGRDNVLAVTASSESYPVAEQETAKRLAGDLSANHIVINTSELKIKKFRKNPENRCYYCKKELFSKLKGIAAAKGYFHVLDGSTVSDLDDIRHGAQAAREEGVKSPLQMAGFRKEDVRAFSRQLKIDIWEKPASACLASRFAYNIPISKDGLSRVEKAEMFIKGLGFKQLRVRVHNSIARIEVDEIEISGLLRRDLRKKIVKKLRSLGFVYITLDMLGYRTGSMHEELDTVRRS